MNHLLRFAGGIVLAVAVMAGSGWAQSFHTAPSEPTAPFPVFEQWKAAVLAGDSAALSALYSTEPPSQVFVKLVNRGAASDVSFWLGLKAKSMKVEIIRKIVLADRASVIFRAEVVSASEPSVAVTDDQGWQKQGDQWRLVSVERTDAPQLKQPSDMNKNIYPADVNAHAELKEAEEKAAAEHKRVLLVFGANWCFDCHVLDLAFRRPDLAPLLAASYEVVHVDLGPDEHKNADLVKQFDVPLNKGIPALAVAESDGKLVVSQKNGEFEDARGLTPELLLEFLNKWKPQGQ
jgi:hypothetical protein